MTYRQSLLKASDVRRFLSAKGAFANCAVCGSSNLNALDEELIGARAAFPVLKREGDQVSSDGLFEVVLVACSNCGGVRVHERRLIEAWLEANPERTTSILG
jgi:hypothetical protein